VVAVAEAQNLSGRKVIEAVVAGYEVGFRVGETLGRTHYEVFHTTATAGVIAAAAAVGRLLVTCWVICVPAETRRGRFRSAGALLRAPFRALPLLLQVS
jgi:hypothetical protein